LPKLDVRVQELATRKVVIPPASSTVIDKATVAGKATNKLVDLNNLAYSEL
jgi:hypothetical protein